MATQAIIGAGSIFQINNSGVFTAIANLKSITAPDISITSIDVTVLTSPNHTREKSPGFVDSGEMSCEGLFTAVGYALLYASLESVLVWRITLSNGSHFDFTGFITKLHAAVPLDGEINDSFSITITGPVLFTQ